MIDWLINCDSHVAEAGLELTHYHVAEAGLELCALLHTIPTRLQQPWPCAIGGFYAVTISWFVLCCSLENVEWISVGAGRGGGFIGLCSSWSRSGSAQM